MCYPLRLPNLSQSLCLSLHSYSFVEQNKAPIQAFPAPPFLSQFLFLSRLSSPRRLFMLDEMVRGKLESRSSHRCSLSLSLPPSPSASPTGNKKDSSERATLPPSLERMAHVPPSVRPRPSVRVSDGRLKEISAGNRPHSLDRPRPCACFGYCCSLSSIYACFPSCSPKLQTVLMDRYGWLSYRGKQFSTISNLFFYAGNTILGKGGRFVLGGKGS